MGLKGTEYFPHTQDSESGNQQDKAQRQEKQSAKDGKQHGKPDADGGGQIAARLRRRVTLQAPGQSARP
ncbi:hypothetical protein Pure05_09230 [Paenarthrobacter ureafaciens]|nr:hypothetical protein NicSoilE8_13150 [Arthrobacter sp. NicSoilE8]GLU57947.1 hypothetical protein Pure01_04600 [Paenarthrobacter ureafaciens]GLU62676.1 hypothetical protein Pure02_09260 [Paenarthrobacter ureafaciens]GLU66836.1 hypothetical protein Pure03_08120 [Paenarthrobacter ureafaciens]GLU70862.1 hypothetical protein Pure04_05770 [Paenarthrobacter ureafaciens]